MNSSDLIKKLTRRVGSKKFNDLMGEMAQYLPANKVTYRDYSRGLVENGKYMDRATPEVLDGGLKILDVGPGVGCWLLLARTAGNEIEGIDLPVSAAKRINGRGWVWAYKQITDYWKLGIRYEGFQRYLLHPEKWPWEPGHFDMIHSRGSLAAVLTSLGDLKARDTARKLISLWAMALKPGGVVFVAHNAGKPGELFAEEVAKDPGEFEIVQNDAECRLVRK